MEKSKSEIRNLFKRKVFLGKSLVAIGRLEHLKIIQRMLNEFGLELDAIVDNDMKKQGVIVNGVSIYSPEEFLIPFNENRIILIYSPKYWQEILVQFEKMGYKEGENIIVLEKPNLSSNIYSIIKGFRIYKSLEKKYGKQTKIFLCNCPLGDFYLLGIYFNEYIKENNIDNYVVVGTSKGLRELAGLFGLTNFEELRPEETTLLTGLYSFMSDALNLKVLTIWQGAFRFNPCITRQKKDFTFIDTFKSFIYNLNEDAPKKLPEFEGGKSIIKVLEEKCLEKNNTVILAPYSYSMQSLPIIFWKKLSDKLIEKGFKVAVNIDDGREVNSIDGTQTLNINLKESIDALEYSGYLVGIRSGFFDVTSSAKCKRVVFYPQKIKGQITGSWNSTDLDFNSLKLMGLCDDAKEIEFIRSDLYDEAKSELLLKQIIEGEFNNANT